MKVLLLLCFRKWWTRTKCLNFVSDIWLLYPLWRLECCWPVLTVHHASVSVLAAQAAAHRHRLHRARGSRWQLGPDRGRWQISNILERQTFCLPPTNFTKFNPFHILRSKVKHQYVCSHTLNKENICDILCFYKHFLFENEDESPTVLTNNIIKYSYLLYISTHYSESSSDSVCMNAFATIK